MDISGLPGSSWLTLAKDRKVVGVTTINVGQAKSDLSRLIALAEAGEEVEIARDGVPVVRLVPIRQPGPGAKFLAAAGSLQGMISIGEDFELTDTEVDETLES